MRWPRMADAVVAIVVFLMSLFFWSENSTDDDLLIRAFSDLSISGIILVFIASGALYWRRNWPLHVLGLTLTTLALSTALGYSYDYFGLPIAIYSVGRYVSNDRLSDAGLVVAILVAAMSELVTEGPIEDIGGAFFVLLLVWFIGRRIRIRGEDMNLLQERAAQLEREQKSEARRAVAEERTRIARELHDVVAHQVSLMTVQAGAAKTVAVDDPTSAIRAMEAVEKAGRQALNELRHLLGILRPESEIEESGPQPGVADVPRLIKNLEQAGLAVSLSIIDVPENLPVRVDLSTYRIVQEALTNVLKHAGPNARTEVRLSSENDNIIIEVFDNGQGITTLPGSGHGIAGMRERVQLLSGRFNAGPRSGGGFEVIAHLPIEKESI